MHKRGFLKVATAVAVSAVLPSTALADIFDDPYRIRCAAWIDQLRKCDYEQGSKLWNEILLTLVNDDNDEVACRTARTILQVGNMPYVSANVPAFNMFSDRYGPYVAKYVANDPHFKSYEV